MVELWGSCRRPSSLFTQMCVSNLSFEPFDIYSLVTKCIAIYQEILDYLAYWLTIVLVFFGKSIGLTKCINLPKSWTSWSSTRLFSLRHISNLSFEVWTLWYIPIEFENHNIMVQLKLVALLVLWSWWSFEGAVGDPQLFVLSFGCSIVLVRDLSNFYQNLNASRADMRSPVINQKQAL